MTDDSDVLSTNEQPETSLRRVIPITQLILLIVILLLAGPVFALLWPARQVDSRLLGTWQSDADRTIANMLGEPPHDEKREAKLRNLFGKMRVTWTTTHCTSDLEGTIDSGTYEVLGRDQNSVVIQSHDTEPDPLDFLNLSSFLVIHFEGSDTYWIDSETGGMREYFKKVK